MHDKPADCIKSMTNTAEELSTISNVSVHLQTLDKNISFCILKYGDHKNEDCSLTYPDINEKRKQIDVVLMYAPSIKLKCEKIQQVA